MEVDVRHLRHFLAVAEHEHFGRAAAALYIAQPALSQSIQRLEALTGLQLFHRHPRGTALTEAGEALLPVARSAVASLDEVRRTAERLAAGRTQSLRVGFLANAANELTPQIVTAFRAAYPDVELSVVQADWASPHALLDHPDPRRRVDVAILRLPINDPKTIAIEPLFSEPCDVVLYSGHPLADRASLSVEDVLDEPIVHNTSPPGPFRDFWLLTSYRDAQHPPAIGGAHTTPDEWLSSITAGDGISICPRSAGRYYPRPGLLFRPLDDGPDSVVALAWRADDLPPAAAAFLDVTRRVRDTSPLLPVAAGMEPREVTCG